MKYSLSGSFIFSVQEAKALKKLRIIKQNLIHVQGLPRSLANTEILKSSEYFGQYGKIKNIVLSSKMNQDSNKEVYSVYITYKNKIEAACAILCVDSLLINGKIIRAFFGTTKYCSYFLENRICQSSKKCAYLHQLVSNKDIIIDVNTKFSYNEHLNMSKKIISQSILEIKNILKEGKKSKGVLPPIEFIFLSEAQKEKYLGSGNINYVKSNENKVIDFSIKNNFIINNIYNLNNIRININNDNIIQKNEFNYSGNIQSENNVDTKNFNDLNPICDVNIKRYQDPFELYNIFKDSIKHILLSKPFFTNIKNTQLKKMEYNYFKNDLLKKGIDINLALGGCLDCISDCI